MNDIFVLLRAYEITPSSHAVPDRMRATMQEGGVSTMLTSITALMVFGVGGANSPFGGVRTFCIYCGVGIFLDFIFRMTFFIGFMVLDSRHQQSRSVTACCCAGGSDSEGAASVQRQTKCIELHVEIGTDSAAAKSVKLSSGTPSTRSPISTPSTASPMDTVHTPSTIGTSDAGSPSKTIKEISTDATTPENENKKTEFKLTSTQIPAATISENMDNLGLFLMDNLWVKMLVFILFVAYSTGAVVGILKVDIGSALDSFFPMDSYLRDVFEANDRYFNVIGTSTEWVIDEEVDYSNDTVMAEIGNLMNTILSDECFVNESSWTSSWIQEYSDYLDVHYGGNVNQTAFYDILFEEFLLSDAGQRFTEDIWSGAVVTDNEEIDKSTYSSIRRSRFTVPAVSYWGNTQEATECLDNLHRIQQQYASSLGLFFSKTNQIGNVSFSWPSIL